MESHGNGLSAARRRSSQMPDSPFRQVQFEFPVAIEIQQAHQQLTFLNGPAKQQGADVPRHDLPSHLAAHDELFFLLPQQFEFPVDTFLDFTQFQ